MRNEWAREDAESFGRFRLVGIISLWFSAVAVVGLAATFFWVQVPDESYLERLQMMSTTRRYLPVLLLGGGSLLLLGTALTTWVITLYSSWRVAGPLLHLCRYLDADQEGEVLPALVGPHIGYLAMEARLLEQTVVGMEGYRIDLEARLAEAQRLIEMQAPPEQIKAVLKDIQTRQAAVSLEGR